IDVERGHGLARLDGLLAQQIGSAPARLEDVTEDTEGDLRLGDGDGQVRVSHIVPILGDVERPAPFLPGRAVRDQHYRRGRPAGDARKLLRILRLVLTAGALMDVAAVVIAGERDEREA